MRLRRFALRQSLFLALIVTISPTRAESAAGVPIQVEVKSTWFAGGGLLSGGLRAVSSQEDRLLVAKSEVMDPSSSGKFAPSWGGVHATAPGRTTASVLSACGGAIVCLSFFIFIPALKPFAF